MRTAKATAKTWELTCPVCGELIPFVMARELEESVGRLSEICTNRVDSDLKQAQDAMGNMLQAAMFAAGRKEG